MYLLTGFWGVLLVIIINFGNQIISGYNDLSSTIMDI